MSVPKTHLRSGPLLVTIGALVWLGGCSSTPASKSADEIAAPPAQPGENPQIHFDRAMDLLEQGNADEADAELHTYLDAVPKSKPAQFLVEQIETPVGKLFPKRSFRLKLSKNANLSSLAKAYLGNSLAFYGLARYNGIAVPAEVHEGQTVKIPKTPAALAARRAADQTPAAPAAPVETADLSPDDKPQRLSSESDRKEPAPAPPVSHAKAERYYRAGLIAFQKQDLDAAIAAWRKALTADPGFTDAQLHLREAERLKQSLKQFQK